MKLLLPLVAFVATNVPSDPMSSVVLHLLTYWPLLCGVAVFDELPADTSSAARGLQKQDLMHEVPHLDLRILLPHPIKMLAPFVWSENGSLLPKAEGVPHSTLPLQWASLGRVLLLLPGSNLQH